MYLLPKPQKQVMKDGKFNVNYRTVIVLDDSCEAANQHHAHLLQEEIEKSAGVLVSVRREMTVAEKENGNIYLSVETAENPESYRLHVTEDNVSIIGGGVNGLLYGIQTLRQMFRQEGAQISCLEIEDYPQMANRGFYHDATRSRIGKMSWFKKLADTLSFYKMNQLQLYVEHTYLFKDLSEMWRDDTPLTAEDIMELDDYCSKIGIELVPSLSSFGHLYKLLRTNQYQHLCELPNPRKMPFSLDDRMGHHTINVLLDESYELITGMINEFMPLFRSKKFNICCDETFDLGRGATKEKVKEIGTDRLYIDFVNKLCKFVVSKGRVPMFWGDIICGFPEFITELPKETICLNWDYSSGVQENNTRKMAEAGATQYVCPGVGGWNMFMNLIENAYLNISKMCTYGVKYNAIGMLNTDWGDFGHINHPAFGIPGLIIGAACSWNKDIIPYEEISRQISRIEYMDNSESYVELLNRISKNFVFGWWHVIKYKDAVNGVREDAPENFLLNTDEKKNAAKEAMKNLAALKEEAGAYIHNLDAAHRGELQAVQIAVDAMIILDKVALVISGEEATKAELYALAKELEEWYYYFKNLWRSVSRESELYHVSDTIFWYADRLRDMGNNL